MWCHTTVIQTRPYYQKKDHHIPFRRFAANFQFQPLDFFPSSRNSVTNLCYTTSDATTVFHNYCRSVSMLYDPDVGNKGAPFMGKNYEQVCNCAFCFTDTAVKLVYTHIHVFILDYPDSSCKQNPSNSNHIIRQRAII